MSMDKAKSGIFAEWDKVRHENHDATTFYFHLKDTRPDLLEFKSIDQYQDMKSWLMESGRLDYNKVYKQQ